MIPTHHAVHKFIYYFSILTPTANRKLQDFCSILTLFVKIVLDLPVVQIFLIKLLAVEKIILETSEDSSLFSHGRFNFSKVQSIGNNNRNKLGSLLQNTAYYFMVSFCFQKL